MSDTVVGQRIRTLLEQYDIHNEPHPARFTLDYDEMCNLYGDVARDLGISRANVSSIHLRKTWRHLV